MKKVKYLTILLISLFLIGTLNVQAEEEGTTGNPETTEETENTEGTGEKKDYITWVENTKYSMEAVYGSTYITFNFKGVDDYENTYYIFTNGEKPETFVNVSKSGLSCEFKQGRGIKGFKKINTSKIIDSSEWYVREGYNTMWVLNDTMDENRNHYCEISGPITVEKPALPELGNRYSIYLGLDVLSDVGVYYKFPKSNELSEKSQTLKVGIVNDNDLLKKLSKNTSGSLSLLLEYAKSNEGTSFELNDGKANFDNFTVIPGAYYYLYITLNEPDGYRDLSDINLAMSVPHADDPNRGYLTTDIVWVNSEDVEIPDANDKTNDEITNNSKTGDALIFIVWVIGIGALAYSVYYFKTKKNSIEM